MSEIAAVANDEIPDLESEYGLERQVQIALLLDENENRDAIVEFAPAPRE
jgi:hypothetical protein